MSDKIKDRLEDESACIQSPTPRGIGFSSRPYYGISLTRHKPGQPILSIRTKPVLRQWAKHCSRNVRYQLGVLRLLQPHSQIFHKSGDHYRLTFLSRFDRRTTLKQRVQPIPCPSCGIAWCRPGTQSYLIIKTGWAASNAWFLHDLVAAALMTAGHYLTNGGDRVMSSAVATSFHTQEGLTLTVANANNHQLTWGVFSVAMEALDDFIRANGGFVSATFDVYDGRNQVGTGKIQ